MFNKIWTIILLSLFVSISSIGSALTKAELLTELNAHDWVISVDTPTLLETKPNGTKWYIVNFMEQVGNAGVASNIHFYVVDEGEAGENAFYKNAEPAEAKSRQTSLKKWMINAIDTNPNNYKGIQILWISERYNMIIFSILEGSPLEQTVYYVRRGNGSPAIINNFNIELIKSILQQ